MRAFTTHSLHTQCMFTYSSGQNLKILHKSMSVSTTHWETMEVSRLADPTLTVKVLGEIILQFPSPKKSEPKIAPELREVLGSNPTLAPELHRDERIG